MQLFESEEPVNARSSTVWDIITDDGNLTVWESGITSIEGEIRNGALIRIRTTGGGGRTYRTRVQQLPGQVMIWKTALVPGLLRWTRTYSLSPEDGLTRLRVKDQFDGPLLRFSNARLPVSQQDVYSYVAAVRRRAELLDRRA